VVYVRHRMPMSVLGSLPLLELRDVLVERFEEIGAAGLHGSDVVGDRLVVYLIGHPHAVPQLNRFVQGGNGLGFFF
jgi:hypothetical protein